MVTGSARCPMSQSSIPILRNQLIHRYRTPSWRHHGRPPNQKPHRPDCVPGAGHPQVPHPASIPSRSRSSSRGDLTAEDCRPACDASPAFSTTNGSTGEALRPTERYERLQLAGRLDLGVADVAAVVGAAIGAVEPLAAGEVVVVGPTGQRVVAVATPDGVVPPCPADQVHTPEPIDDVVAGQAVDDIVAFGALDAVLLSGAQDRGRLPQTDDLLLALDRRSQEERSKNSHHRCRQEPAHVVPPSANRRSAGHLPIAGVPNTLRRHWSPGVECPAFMSGSPVFVRLITIVVLTTGWAVTTVPVRAQPSGPNVVIILTDDQRATETLQAMPKTTAWLAQGGVQFPNAYATTPLCCPSRAAIMTGQLNHNNGVHRNLDKALLPQGNTIQRILGDAGYATGIAGKYLNGWRQSDGPPPHFDRYSVITRTSTDDEFDADNYTQTTFLEEDSPVEKQVTTYSTDYIAQEAQDFLLDWHADDPSRPWFLYAAPFAPHSPWIPEPAYSAAGVGTWAGNPAVFEADRTDKPPYVRNQAHTFAEGQQIRTQQLRTLLSVDDLVDQVFETIEATGDLGNTVAFFLSDNGFMWGEHGVLSKKVPYTDSIRIPFLVRWPGRLAPGTVDERIVANIDVAPSSSTRQGSRPDTPWTGSRWPLQSLGPSS